jgi:hypothetical protein
MASILTRGQALISVSRDDVCNQVASGIMEWWARSEALAL